MTAGRDDPPDQTGVGEDVSGPQRDLRTVVMNFRCSPAERDLIERAAGERGVNLSEYCRMAALQRPGRSGAGAPWLSPEERDLARSLLKQVQGLANNVNQIAAKLHMMHFAPVDERKLRDALVHEALRLEEVVILPLRALVKGQRRQPGRLSAAAPADTASVPTRPAAAPRAGAVAAGKVPTPGTGGAPLRSSMERFARQPRPKRG